MAKKKITKLKFYQLAKEHFSKSENRIETVLTGRHPKALCSFLSTVEDEYDCVMIGVRDEITSDVIKTQNKAQKSDVDFWEKHNTAYFPNHKDRMNFINKQIEKLTKK